LNPDQRELLELLGFVFLQNARPEKAEVVFTALAALEPRNARHALRLALSQVRGGKHEAALSRLDRLLESGDISAAVHLLRGQALARLGREPEAERALRAYVAARAAEPAAAVEGAGP